MAKSEIEKFRRAVWRNYQRYGRHNLPWRKTRNPYRVLVSEVMLQQTQVERVIPFYAEFTRRFPTPKHLASASLASVLQMWQGLGYNRRAKQLQAAARALVTEHPRTVEELERLPGVGPYTARAIAAFAWNQDTVLVETNIRTAVIHHFFKKRRVVSDAEIERILARALPAGRTREWYSALMDYGARLKRTGKSYNVKIKKYVKQSKFADSAREARGVIVRELSRGGATAARLVDLLGPARRAQMRAALRALWKEGMIQKRDESYTLPD